MRNHKGDSQNMNNSSPSRRRKKYDKEMDQAFTLIFHNIKRLQDDRLSNSAPNLDQADVQPEKIKPAMTLKVPFQRPRFKSDPSLSSTERDTEQRSDIRVKSGSFSGADSSPLQRRKVRFADDYAAKDRLKIEKPSLTRRPWSDLQPVIVVTNDS